MADVTIVINGHTYSSGFNPTHGMAGYGYTTLFFPLIEDVLVVASEVAANKVEAEGFKDDASGYADDALSSALDAAASATTATLAPGTSATSTTNLTIGPGVKSLVIQTGKLFALGHTVVIADTTAPSVRQMIGIVTAHNSGTGDLSVDVPGTGVIGSGTVATWTVSLTGARGVSSILTLPMLSTAAAAQTCISPMMPIFESNHTIAAVDMVRIMWAGSQFIAVPSTANVNVYTSPDLKAWAARSVSGASSAWVVRNNGLNVIACLSSGSAPRKSTDGGLSWAATTALPGSIAPVNAAYTSSGIFFTGTTTVGYVTTDHGTTWSASQTLPHTSTNLFAVGANFVSYASASNTYYTSTTGLTGSWTTRSLPSAVASSSIYDDGSGGLIMIPTDTTKNFWGTTDGINWTDLGFNAASYSSGGLGTVTFYVPFNINGVWCVGSNNSNVGSVLVKHASSKWMPTQCGALALSLSTVKHSLVAGNGAGLYGVKPTGSSNILIADGASSKNGGYFI